MTFETTADKTILSHGPLSCYYIALSHFTWSSSTAGVDIFKGFSTIRWDIDELSGMHLDYGGGGGGGGHRK